MVPEEPYLRQYNTGEYAIEYGVEMFWYVSGDFFIDRGMYMFYNSMIYIGRNTTFLVKNITKTEYGYKVTCLGPDEIKETGSPIINIWQRTVIPV
jgi:hypothetical protein